MSKSLGTSKSFESSLVRLAATAALLAASGTAVAGKVTPGGELAVGAGGARLVFDPCGGGPPSYHPGCTDPLVHVDGAALQLHGMGGVWIRLRHGFRLFAGGGLMFTHVTSSDGTANMIAGGGGVTATFRGIAVSGFVGIDLARAHIANAGAMNGTAVRTEATTLQDVDGGGMALGGSLGYMFTSQLGVYVRADLSAMMHGNFVSASATAGLALRLGS